MANQDSTDCCIVGGGPAGVLLGLMLSRAGVRVALFEAHSNFDRDFRGDTVHAATLELLDQLGLADRLHELPHGKLRTMDLDIDGRSVRIADLSTIPSRFGYVMVMPQAEFLAFVAEEADKSPNFRRYMGAPVVGVLTEGDRITGVRYRSEGVEQTLNATLTIACDGRFSRMRKFVGVEAEGVAPPMDVAWFRLPREAGDHTEAGAIYLRRGRMMVMLTRIDEWQFGYVFPKGDFSALKARGLDAFRESIESIVPWLSNRTALLTDWSQVHLLSVGSDCLRCWHRPGVLFIGDAAHVMSPVLGVGINYAIADAVVSANVLQGPLAAGTVSEAHLASIQRSRERPTHAIQRIQTFIQRRIVAQALSGRDFALPLPLRILMSLPWINRLPARAAALGIGRPRYLGPL